MHGLKPLPSPDTLRAIAMHAARNSLPLDDLLFKALFNGERPILDGDWPPAHRRAYMDAVSIWREERQRYFPPLHRTRCSEPPTLEQAWDVVAAASPDPDEWWRVPNLSWSLIGQALGVAARVAAYHLCDIQGWRFAGNGPGRLVTIAPCLVCTRPGPAWDIENQHCGQCCC